MEVKQIVIRYILFFEVVFLFHLNSVFNYFSYSRTTTIHSMLRT